MLELTAADAEGARFDGRNQVEKVVEGYVGCGEPEIVENFEYIPSGPVAILVQLLLTFRRVEFDKLFLLRFVCREMDE